MRQSRQQSRVAEISHTLARVAWENFNIDRGETANIAGIASIFASILTNEDDRHLSVREAADYLGLTKSWLDQLRCRTSETERPGPPFHQPVPGGKVTYKKSELDKWKAGRI